MYPNFLMNFLHILQGQSQLAHNVSETSPERPLKVLASGAYRGPSEASEGTNTKTDDLTKQLLFRSSSPCITYLLLLFTGRTFKNILQEKYSKVLIGDVQGKSRGPSCGMSRGPNDGTF